MRTGMAVLNAGSAAHPGPPTLVMNGCNAHTAMTPGDPGAPIVVNVTNPEATPTQVGEAGHTGGSDSANTRPTLTSA